MSIHVTPPARPCPMCGRPSVHEVRPFCSRRCRDEDFLNWAGGVYRIPVEEEDSGREEDSSGQD